VTGMIFFVRPFPTRMRRKKKVQVGHYFLFGAVSNPRFFGWLAHANHRLAHANLSLPCRNVVAVAAICLYIYPQAYLPTQHRLTLQPFSPALRNLLTLGCCYCICAESVQLKGSNVCGAFGLC
jgi:hypothetical protein